jgi:ABC-type methionine transport system permease subunit
MDEDTMTPKEIEACWEDPRNRKWGVYYCRADPRVIVPRHAKWMGWTVNAARPSAIPVVLLLLALLAIPMFVVSASGGESGAVLLTAAASGTVICLVCAYLSSTTRYEAKDPMDS